MKDVILSLLLGMAIGAIIVSAYYDGFVADEYKQKIQKASEGLYRADIQIRSKDKDINTLLHFIDALREQNNDLSKQLKTIPRA